MPDRTSFFGLALASVVALATVSCSDDDDAKSNGTRGERGTGGYATGGGGAAEGGAPVAGTSGDGEASLGGGTAGGAAGPSAAGVAGVAGFAEGTAGAGGILPGGGFAGLLLGGAPSAGIGGVAGMAGVPREAGFAGRGGSGGAPPKMNVVSLSRDTCNITVPTRWSAAVYAAADCDISVNAALTLDPGVVIKFGPDRSMIVSTSGMVTASGTAALPIVFTSLKDDAVGDDSNDDGARTEPGGGDWAGVRIEASGSTFDHCGFYYGGGANTGALSLLAGAPTARVNESIFAHNRATGSTLITTAAALDAHLAGPGTVITGNTFYDNTVPLSISPSVDLDDSNAFDGSASTPALPQPSRYNGVVIAADQPLRGNVTWAISKVPLILGSPVQNDLVVGSDGHLTLGQNTTVKFFRGGSLEVSGILSADGGAGRIVFTSMEDDAHGGDTNGDGTATVPLGGSWAGIRVLANGSVFNRCDVLYGGADMSSALWIDAGLSTTVTGSVFAHCRSNVDSMQAPAAVNASVAGAGTVISANLFHDNLVPLAISSNLSLDDSNSFDNASAAPTAPQPNTYNGIMVPGDSTVRSSIAWSATKAPFVIGDPTFTALSIDPGKLTLGDGAIVKLFPGGRISVTGANSLVAGGAVFTSVYDDTRGGDTNADGAATAGSSGSWYGIVVYPASGGAHCQSEANMFHYTPPAANGTCR